uniref:Helicase ATP-binding domain-containing protein n=1 Tax=Guillardia theta TaxID=55529 RepID=A0A7S4L6K9_GUITH|mmetsp:Transcript_38495/g.121298  ORF Transcript_38495/g.121298 Transcript_38495/m.121298 type:complete len:1330 (+) Transcript_38495:192-4181(+)
MSRDLVGDRKRKKEGKDEENSECVVDWSIYPKPKSPRSRILLFVSVDVHNEKLDLKGEHSKIRSIMCMYADIKDLAMPYLSTWEEAMKEVKLRNPVILHFACHSQQNAVNLLRRDVSPDVIVECLQAHNEEMERSGSEQVQLVVFNACYSDEHANKAAKVVDFSVGHNGQLDDEDALAFTENFYTCLFRGESLSNAMTQGKGSIPGYRMFGRRDAREFRFPSPTLHGKEAGAASREDTEMVKFYRDSGFTMKRALEICEKLEIKDWTVEDLRYLEDDKPNVDDQLRDIGLHSYQRKKFWDDVRAKVKEIQLRTANLSSSSEDESEVSEADTLSQSTMSDESDSEDEASQGEVIVSRNQGHKEVFEADMRRFLQEFGRFTGNFEVSVKDGEGAMETVREGKPPQAWTMCMLLWLRVVKDASVKDRAMEIWYDHVLSASEDELLSRLNSMLVKNHIQHRHWDRTKFVEWDCEKHFARVVYLTDQVVKNSIPNDAPCKLEWNEKVMMDWNKNEEKALDVLKRINKFLWSQAESIQVFTDVIETQSYVCYMRMEKIVSMILFEYLETCRKVAESSSEGKAVDPSLFQGFTLFVSTSSRSFVMQKIKSERLREIRSNLRVLSILPPPLLTSMGPVRRAEELLEEEGRSTLTAHQKEKAKECEEAMGRRRGVHLRGPAGTGKTFLALHMMLRELEKDKTCTILFLLRSEAFVFFIAHWVWSMVRWKLVDHGLFDRIFFSFRGEDGWDGPFWMTEEGAGELRREEKRVELLSEEESEYKFVVIDEAHHVYCDREARDYIELKRYDKARMMLMSESSQADVTDISYPQWLEDVYLTEVVRNSNRTMTASLLFQKGISIDAVSCHHNVSGRPVKPYIFSLGSSDNQAREYATYIVEVMREVMVEYPGNLDRKIAILVHERLVQLNLKQILQDHLDKDSALPSSFKLIAAVDAWKTTRGREDESDDQNIIFDTVANFDGMESKVVIAVGLDEKVTDEDLNLHRSLLYRAITRALKEGTVMIVNHRVEQGLLSFLDGLRFANKFDAEDEKEKISKKPWVSPKEEHQGRYMHSSYRSILSTASGPEMYSESKSEDECNDDEDYPGAAAGKDTDHQVQEETSQIVQSVWDTRRHEGGGVGGEGTETIFQPYRRTRDQDLWNSLMWSFHCGQVAVTSVFDFPYKNYSEFSMNPPAEALLERMYVLKVGDNVLTRYAIQVKTTERWSQRGSISDRARRICAVNIRRLRRKQKDDVFEEKGASMEEILPCSIFLRQNWPKLLIDHPKDIEWNWRDRPNLLPKYDKVGLETYREVQMFLNFAVSYHEAKDFYYETYGRQQCHRRIR